MEDEPKRICDFDPKVLAALEQVKHWQAVYGFDFRNLPDYHEAASASEKAVFQRISVGADKVCRNYPDALGWMLKAAFAENRRKLLSTFASNILDAANNDNEDFFIALGACLYERKLQTLQTLPSAAFAESCQGLVDALWADGLLWLMTDKAAVNYFATVLGLKISSAAYKAAYSRRGYVKHPDLPVIGITKEANVRRQNAGAKSKLSKPRSGPSYTLDLRPGWIFSEHTLMRVSR